MLKDYTYNNNGWQMLLSSFTVHYIDIRRGNGHDRHETIKFDSEQRKCQTYGRRSDSLGSSQPSAGLGASTYEILIHKVSFVMVACASGKWSVIVKASWCYSVLVWTPVWKIWSGLDADFNFCKPAAVGEWLGRSSHNRATRVRDSLEVMDLFNLHAVGRTLLIVYLFIYKKKTSATLLRFSTWEITITNWLITDQACP